MKLNDSPLTIISRLLKPRKGQTIVIFPLMIFLVVAMTMMAVNYSYLSQKRIELQITADASARAGAFVQAECLTGIANLNYIVVVLNPIIVILDALSAIPFLEFLKAVSEFLTTLIESIINPAQTVIQKGAPFASFAAVLGQGLVNDSNTWSIMIPDRRWIQGNFLCIESKPVEETGVVFGYTGSVMVRKYVPGKDENGNPINENPLFSTIIEGLGVLSFKPDVSPPFEYLPGMLGGSKDKENHLMYAFSAAKPYYTKTYPRSGMLDIYNKYKAMGICIWAPVNPWDARLTSWDTYIKEAALGKPDEFAKSTFDKIMKYISTLSTYKPSISDIFKYFFS